MPLVETITSRQQYLEQFMKVKANTTYTIAQQQQGTLYHSVKKLNNKTIEEN